MKKSEQIKINALCNDVFNAAMREYYEEQRNAKTVKKGKPLRHCQAKVFETENFYILQSYETLIAAIRKDDNICVNNMRHEYHFDEYATGATSTQQFYKFVKDYVPFGKCPMIYTYKAV